MGSVSSDPGAETRTMKSQPLPLEVPVVATGARPGDQSEKRELFTEETETVLVFEHGAVIHLAAAVAVGQLVFLTNKQTGKEIVTQVLRKRSYRPTACYVELDFTEAAPGFWGVEFPKAEADAKVNLPEAGEAAAVAEAEITEEEFGPSAPPPDEAEVARLRREVEALKSQVKSLATPSEQQTAKHLSEMQQPSASELENLKSLMGSKKPAEEPEEEAKPGRDDAENAPAKLDVMSPHEPKPEPVKSEAAGQEEGKPAPDGEAENGSTYPIRMQLPKAQGTSNRTSEFAADSAAITAAIEDHLLPKPSLDFERFPGVAEPKTKLFSGKATRSLSGPIGVMVAAVLFLVAAGIATYQFGWLPKFGAKSSKSAANKSAFPPAAAVDSSLGQADPQTDLNTPRVNPVATEEPMAAANSGHAGATEAIPNSVAASPKVTAAGNSHAEAAASKSIVQPAPDKRGAMHVVAPSKTAVEPTLASKGEDIIVPPKLVKAIRSLSPPEALWRYTSGNVVLDALVNETGHVESATVISGPEALHQRAITTVKEYLYQAATKNGKPIPAHVEVKIQFWYEP